jgi:type II secretory pathway pseudopilin PulG
MPRSTHGWLTLTRWNCVGIAIATVLGATTAWAGAIPPRATAPHSVVKQAENTDLTEAERRARVYIGTFNRAQQAYRLEHPTFATRFSDLQVGVDTETEAYTYEIVLANGRQVVTIAWPNRPDLRTVVGLVGVYDGQSSAKLCLSQATTAVSPHVPIFAPGVEPEVTCPAGFE